MIVTRQPRIPISWLIMTMVPWVFFYFLITVGGVNFFVLNRLIDNPAALTFAISLPVLLFTILPLSSYISYTSDRVWTRWGRRKIFLVFGFSGVALVMLAYPFAPTVFVFIGLMFLAQFFGCFNSPFEALKLEIIPPAMRGRTAAIGTWIITAINILFWMTVIGRFDEVIPFMGIQLSGDKIIFWSASAGLVIALFIYLFGIHELPPHSKITGEKFRLKTMWLALTSPQLRYLYVFGIAAGMLAANLGALGQLLYINQWGYSLQEMGSNIAIGGVINLFLIPVIGFLADKGKGQNRMRIWLTCLSVILLLNISYFAYVTWYLPDQRPSLVEIIFFGELTCVVGIASGVVYYPLVYDYVPRNLMGTYFAGMSILGGLFGFITVNGLGLFMLMWAKLFQPPAGEMARVCLQHEMRSAQVTQILAAANLSAPDGGKALPKDIVVHPWFANGIVQQSGLCQEIRLRDPIGDGKRARQEDLKKQIDLLEAKKSPSDANKLQGLVAENKILTEDLARRTKSWSDQVVHALEKDLIRPGDEILGSTMETAGLTLLPTLRKCKEREVDRLNKILRDEDPAVLGVRTVHRDRNFFLLISRILPAGADKDSAMNAFTERVKTLAGSQIKGLVSPGAVHAEVQVRQAMTVRVALVENPLPTFISPVTRVVNALLSLFVELPPPDQKLISLARNLGAKDENSIARVDALKTGNGLRVTTMLEQGTREAPPALAAGIVARVREEGASLKLTVPAALVDKGVVPIKYNYLAGYLYIFTMVLCGFGLVGFFLIKEKAGAVRKLGAEEIEKENALTEEKKRQVEAAAAAPGTDKPGIAPIQFYTPGYLFSKIVFALLGLAVVVMALGQAWPQLQLLAVGQRVEAVAVAARAVKPGLPVEIFKTQAELDAKTKSVRNAKDYNWTFYNDFLFETTAGAESPFRWAVGSKLKPPMPLLDENGLPTTARLLYDPKNPSSAVLPLEYSTWFMPGLIGIFGFLAFLVGTTLAACARKPIELAVEEGDGC